MLHTGTLLIILRRQFCYLRQEKIMVDTFHLGSIPPLSAWEGEALNFTVKSTLGERARFTKRAIPSPKGRTSIDEKTGTFTYQPAPEDKDEFAVWIRARVGAKEESQKVYVTPHPQLPSDFKVIEHVSKEPPDPASRFYTTFSQEDAGEAHFNRKGLDDDARVMTTKVTVVGVKLVIEDNKDEGSLYNRLKDRENLRQLILCADEVVIRCELKVPGTDVYLYARRLRFEDDGDKIGRIITTPLPYKAASTRDVGLDGQKAGDVHLFVGSLETPGNADRIITVGGAGQDPRHGEAGAKGTDVPVWNGKVTVEGKEFDFSNDVKKAIAESQFPTGQAIMVHVGEGDDPNKRTEARFDFPSDQWPGDGKDPVRLPGRNGRGGDGGSVFTQFKDQLESRVKLRAGSYGKVPPFVEPSSPGKPVHAIRFWFLYRRPLFSSPQKVHFAIMDWRTSQPGKRGEAPTTMRPMPKKGAISPLPAGTGQFHWLRPATVRAVISYANDAYLSGLVKEARELLAVHLQSVKGAAEADKEEAAWPILQAELSSLLQRIEGPYDYFGNPAGWVPMLSFQANHQLFKTEMESAVRAMFLAYWIQNTQDRAQAAARMLEEAGKHLRAETEQALADYKAAELKVSNLETEMASIADQIESTRKLVSGMKENLVKQVRKDLQTEQILRASAKILGGVMQLIPVGQPVLGSIGKAATVLGDIDVDNPAASLGGVAGAFAPVMTEMVAPKVQAKAKELFSGLKQAKHLAKTEAETRAEEEKEKFDSEVAKAELKKKVKDHLDKKEAAKEGILGGFSQFAVSEDDVKQRLEKVLADTPAYGEAAKAIESLNERKRVFAEDLHATVQAIDVATTTILNNQMAILELRGQRDLRVAQLNLEALQSVQDLGRKARERLLLYQYYLLKSYHYLMLEDLPDMDFRARKLFDAFADMVIPKKNQPSNSVSPDGMLTQSQFKILSGVFEEQLRAVAQNIIKQYQHGRKRNTTQSVVELTPEQIETLNGSAQQVEFDLMWYHHNRQEDDVRITAVTADSVVLAEPFPTRASNLSLDYVHDGVSKVRRDGEVFLFRSGQYRVEGETGKGDSAPRTDIHWGTKITYNPHHKKEDRLTFEPTKPDPEEESLVRYLIGAPVDAKSPMLSFRPGAWAKLAVKRSGDETIKIRHLTLRIDYVFQNVNDKAFRTVAVRVRDDSQPYVRCSAEDANGRADGVGSFLRTFRKTQNLVTLHAPPHYGSRAFRGWLKGDQVDKDGPVIDKSLLANQSLELDLLKSRDFIVEPVYAPVNETPFNDKGEEWPACPVGWVFDDWMFANGTRSELTIDRVYFGMHDEQAEALVNVPQGDVVVKLSFERLKLLPGESTKLSVCIKPDAGPGPNKTGFGWQAGDKNYQVGFSMEGRPLASVTDGRMSPNSLDVDIDNRVLTFARP